MEEVVDYELLGGNRGSMSRVMCLTHLAMHGAYHRGWISDLFGHVAFALAGTAFLDPDILNLRLLSVASGGATYATQGSNLRRWARGRSGLLLTRRSRLALRQAGLHVLPPGRPAALAALRLELPLHAHQLR